MADDARGEGECVTLRQSSWTIPSLGTLGLGTLFMTAAVILFSLQSIGYFDTLVFSTPDTGTAFNISSILEPASGGSTPAATANGPESTVPIVRLVIPKIKVDAPVVVKGVGADGYMETPDNGYDVAWYGFTARPGGAGNAVFSGHVDYYNIGSAVFWNLGKLQPDDLMEIRLEDGTVYTYRVTGKGAFDETDAPVERIVGPTPVESVTLITCTGTFNRATRQYDKRLVIRAERVDEGTPASVGDVRPSSYVAVGR